DNLIQSFNKHNINVNIFWNENNKNFNYFNNFNFKNNNEIIDKNGLEFFSNIEQNFILNSENIDIFI
ncbi:MAG: hypothetical protein NZ891_01415, partial [bacterium]|nr:hypothetical protein [bacterium]MDW8163386.1 hypothetical protein [Candidatus Omnitrophota bacterium]